MILFVSYGGGHIAITTELYKYFTQNDVKVKILPLTTGVEYCNQTGISDYLKLEDYKFLVNTDSEIENLVSKITRSVHTKGLGIPYEHTYMYHLIGISELIDSHGKEKGLKIFEREGRKAFLPISFASKFIDEVEAKAVITTNVPRFEEAFQIASQSRKIKSFAIDDLIGKPLGEIKSDFVFVDNELAKKNLEKSGYSGEIVISGNPVFEKARTLGKKIDNKNNDLLILLQTGIKNMETNKIIEFGEEFYRKFFLKLELSGFCDAFDKIAVRFHPSMQKIKYWNSDRFYFDKNKDLYNSLKQYSNVLGFTSTSVYEAYLMGANVYAFSFGNKYFELPFKYNHQIDFNANSSSWEHIAQVEKNESEFLPSKSIILKTISDEVLCNRK
ncbi:MAG: hypothetical protein JJ953_14025 [Gracilimonas sp.]|uniref:hypothetical protein n=1 Tax=Gracilimonas sp. TaxID=1974203 RepID=UPI001B17EA41|nr:hypothetical protein [Gracilimonas sp.]MBO6587223.1 hypothetical protein [Gracilimonas sp.]MBO6614289.1 hypothetical protein [Gracilimonas sp.]